jgi:hemerythrin-like metal-binding protein/PAS domain S-box-containing protein
VQEKTVFRNYLVQLTIGISFILLFGYLSYSMIEKQMKSAIIESLDSSLDLTEQGLISWFEENKHTVIALASSQEVIALTKKLLAVPASPEALISAPAQQQLRTLIQPQLNAHNLNGFFIISPDNISLASTRDANTGINTPLIDQPLLLEKLWSGMAAISHPQTSKVPLKDKDGQSVTSYPTMFSGAPIRDENNKIIALMTLRINPFNDFTPVLQHGRIGETGETYAFNSQGMLISNSRFDDQLKDMQLLKSDSRSILNIPIRIPDKKSFHTKWADLPLTHMAKSALSGQNGHNVLGYLDYRGIKVIGSWKWNHDLGMGLAIEQNLDEAYIPIDSSRYIFTVFCTIIVFSFVIWLTGSLRNRNKLEIEIKRRKGADLAAKKFSIAIEQSPVPILITNSDAIIEYVNNAFTKMTGYSLDDSVGQNPKIFQSGQEPITKYKQMWSSLLQGRSWNGTLINKKKDGTIYVDRTIIFPVISDNKELTHFVTIKEDITEKLNMEEHLRHSQKMDAVGQLAGGIAHDFNNLLGIILGNITMIKRKVQLDEKNINRLDSILKATNRATSLTKQLLGFTRKEAQTVKTVNINQILATMDILIEQSVGKGVRIKMSVAHDLWLTDIDPSDLEDAIINISVNAGHAMKRDGDLIIETSNTQHEFIDDESEIKHEKDCVLLSISDTGSGIPPEIISNIFEPFFTTKTKGKGTGLGLAMVFGFVRRSKGDIKVYSEMGVGSSFKIFLPRSINVSASSVGDAIPEKIQIRGTETILIVDDEQDLAHVAESYLNEAGFKTLLAYSGEQALEILQNKSEEIDLVLSDVAMPGKINGYRLADKILMNWPSVRITLTSGFTSSSGEFLFEQNHVSRHLSRETLNKPYSEHGLLHHIRKILDEETFIEWTDKYTTGVAAIDNDHKVLISLLNKSYIEQKANNPNDTFLHILEDIISYTSSHFRREEAVMKACDYPDIEPHLKAHEALLTQLSEYIDLAHSESTPKQKYNIVKLLHDWLFNHLDGMDRDIHKCTKGKEEIARKVLNDL